MENNRGSQLVIDLSDAADGARLVISGEIDISTGVFLRDALRAARERGQPVELEMSGVTFIDSHGVGHLVELAAPRDGVPPVRVVEPSRQVVRVLTLLGLGPMFHLDDVEPPSAPVIDDVG